MTRLLSNLIKSDYIYVNRQVKVLNFNEEPKENEKAIQSVMFADFNQPNDGMVVQQDLTVSSMEKLLREEKEFVGKRMEEMLAKAKEEAESIIAKANEEADRIRELADEEGRKAGYVKGFEEGNKESEQLEKQLEEERQLQKQQYQELVEQVEPQFVSIMIRLIEKITGVIVEDKHEVILYLIQRAFMNTDKGKEFVIHVSKEDYSFVSENKEQLSSAIPNDAKLDVVEDVSLNKNQCMIESDQQVIDCSLDIQLSNLIADLKLLTAI